MTIQSISELETLVEALPEPSKSVAKRIYSINTVKGKLKPSSTMVPWIEKHFGSVEAVEEQTVVKVTNLISFDGAIFNSLRSRRPKQFKDRQRVESRVMDKVQNDPLANPLEDTPEDPFGRISGKHSITASNIAKYDGLHAIIIFKDFNPLGFSREEIKDYLDTGWRWAQEAHLFDTSAHYLFFLWNSLKRAGASLAHGHAQVVLGRGSHYAKIDALRRAMHHYRDDFNSEYFDDLFMIHKDLGLAVQKDDARVLISLTPIKEKETIVISPNMDGSFKDCVYDVLACFRDHMHVTAFNLGIAFPPIGTVLEDWNNFPIVARIVDRGYPWDGSSDIGTMELYAASIISSDPFQIAHEIKNTFKKK